MGVPPLGITKFVALHEVAPDDDHVSVEDCPVVMVEGDAVRRTVGGGVCTVTVYEVQPEESPWEFCAFDWKVLLPVVLQECVVEVAVPLFT